MKATDDLAQLEILLREEINAAERRVNANLLDTERKLRDEWVDTNLAVSEHLDEQDKKLDKIMWFILATLITTIGALIDVVTGHPFHLG